MPKRTRPSEAEQFTEIKHFRSGDEIAGEIEKLKRRVAEVGALKGLRYGDQRIKNATENIRSAILEIFGPNSPEYGEHRTIKFFMKALKIGALEARRGCNTASSQGFRKQYVCWTVSSRVYRKSSATCSATQKHECDRPSSLWPASENC